jgi:hypothetical protein
MQFEIGRALSDFPFAEDMPPSVFFGAAGRPNTDRLTRVHETALGDLWTDAAAWYAREVLEEQLDFVFLNGSFIDNALPRGRIRLSTIVGMTKPDARTDKIVFLTLSGADLKKFMGLGVPVDMLDRVYMSSVALVEIQKGYSTELLGANTLGGAVLIRTAKPKRSLELTARALAGFDGVFRFADTNLFTSAGARQDLFYVKGTVQYRYIDHWRLPDSFEPVPVNPQEKGDRLWSDSTDLKVTALAGLTPVTGLDLWLQYTYQKADKGVSPPERVRADWPSLT